MEKRGWQCRAGHTAQHHPATMERRSECFAVVLSGTISDLSTTLTNHTPSSHSIYPRAPADCFTSSRVHHTAVLAENAVHGARLDDVKGVARSHRPRVY